MHLIVTEKNITARKIAQILIGSVKERKIDGVSVYEGDDTSIVGLSGHIVNIDFPTEFNNWQNTAPKDLIWARTEMKYTQKKIAQALKKLSKDAERVTIATDFDREGELIGVEAYNIIKDANPAIKFDRARYSAITKQEIDRAFTNTVPLDFNLAAAGEARQKIDLVWGAALTRYISLSCGRLGKSFLSVGRVQTPLLALMVDRERDIKGVHAYAVLGDIRHLRGRRGVCPARPQGNRFTDKAKAEAVMLKLGKTGTVSDYRKSEKTEVPPIPFSTTEFIRAASSIGYSAANAMRVAENLYVNGWISYPRTDNTVYPPSLNLREIVQDFASGEFSKYAQRLLEQDKLVPTKARKTTDHPPIYPVASARKSE